MNKNDIQQYTITHNPKPIPTTINDWEFVHDDYDGAPDSGDRRCGCGESFDHCVELIKELELELIDETANDLLRKMKNHCFQGRFQDFINSNAGSKLFRVESMNVGHSSNGMGIFKTHVSIEGQSYYLYHDAGGFNFVELEPFTDANLAILKRRANERTAKLIMKASELIR